MTTKIMKIINSILIGIAIGLVTQANATSTDAYNRTTDTKKLGWMDAGMESVKRKLKDPASAQFRDVFFHRGADGVPVTCGHVNSKNGFGGYIGYQRFVSAGKPELTWIEQQVSDFDVVWDRLCMSGGR